MPKQAKVSARERTEKLSRFSSSEKADQLTELIMRSKAKHERLKMRANRLTAKPPSKKTGKKSLRAADLIPDDLPEEEKHMLQHLVEDAEDNEDNIKSIFEGAFGKLQDDAENPDAHFKNDEGSKRAALALVLSMIPVAERNYRSSRKQTDAYALNAFIDQMRQLTDDLKSVNDADGQMDFIGSKIITPMLLSMAQTLLTETSALKQTVDTEIRDHHAARVVKKAVDDASLSLGKYITEMRNAMLARIGEYLQGDTSSFDLPSLIKRRKPTVKKRRGDHVS